MKIKNYVLTIGAAFALGTPGNHLAAQDTEFKPSGNLWGYVFGDYANKAHNDTLGRGGKNVQYAGTNSLASNNTGNAQAANTQTNAFQIRRMYLGYDYKFAPNFSAQVVLANEQNYDASGLALVTSTTPNTLTTTNGKNTVYVKYVNVKCSNIFKLKNTDLVLGQYQTASFATANGTEPLWAYRSVERTIMDLHNTDGSTDLGASLQGKIWSQQAPDSTKPMFIGYYLQAGNNNGAVPNASNNEKGRVNVFVAALQQKLTIGLYGDYVIGQYSPYKTSSMTMKFYAAYTTERFRVGAEVFQQTNQNSDISIAYSNGKVASGAKNDTTSGVQMGWSVFASAAILKNKLSAFARYDMYNPDTKYNSSNVYSGAYSGIKGSNLTSATFYTQTFYTLGLDWTPNARIHIMPNIWYNGYKTMMSTTLPGGTTNFSDRVQKDYDMVYRLTFYFIFNGNKKVANSGMSY